MITNKNNQDDWLNDDEEQQEQYYDLEKLEASFNSHDFKEAVKENNTLAAKYNENQIIYLQCLERLKIGTMWKGIVKAFGRPKDGVVKNYFVNVGGFDVLCHKKSYEEVEVGQEITIIITHNNNLKVDGMRYENLLQIQWLGKRIKVEWWDWQKEVFHSINLNNYKHLSNLEKDKIRGFVENSGIDCNVEPFLYHLQFSLIGKTLINNADLKYEAPLLMKELYEYKMYNTSELLDSTNPNFKIDEYGNVTFQAYSQLPFYFYSSRVKQYGLNVLK